MIEKILERLEREAMSSADAQTEAIIGMCGASANFYKGEASAYDKAKKIVQEVAKEHGNGWIPVTERLPEENGLEHYEITFLSGINKTPIRSVAIFSKGRWYMPGTNCRDCDRFPFEVIAWKKPSAPYQKGE